MSLGFYSFRETLLDFTCSLFTFMLSSLYSQLVLWVIIYNPFINF